MHRLVMLIALVALVVTACGDSSDSVATVNGEDIPRDAVQSLPYDPEVELTTAEYVELLDVYIAWTVFTQAARDQFGIDPTQEEIDAQITKILFESGAQSEEAFLEAQNISADGLNLTAVQFLIEAGLETALAEEVAVERTEAEDALAQFPEDFTEVCLVHILLPTETEAETVVTRLREGEDVAALAAELSQDPTSAQAGGDLGCAPVSQFVPEFTAVALNAPVDEVVEPTQTDFGFHVLMVASRVEPTIESVLSELRTGAVFELIDEWYVDVLAIADVTVDPAYGVWQSGSTARLVPPEG